MVIQHCGTCIYDTKLSIITIAKHVLGKPKNSDVQNI